MRYVVTDYDRWRLERKETMAEAERVSERLLPDVHVCECDR